MLWSPFCGRVFAAGSYVIIGLKDIPAELAQAFVRRVYGDASQQAVTSIATLTGLLRHETKMTVVNAAILRNIAFKEPLKVELIGFFFLLLLRNH